METPIALRAADILEDDFPLMAMRIRQRDSEVLHSHEFSELVIVMGGSGRHAHPDGSYEITAGDVFVLHGDQAHGYKETHDLEIINLLFRMDELPLPLLDVGALPGFHALFTLEPVFRRRDGFQARLRLGEGQREAIAELVDRLMREGRGGAPGRRFAAVACFMLIVIDLCRCYAHMEDTSVQSVLGLGSVLGYLHKNFSEQVTLDDLARIGRMSRRTLSRDIKRALGCSPIDYLIRLRVEKAKDLLRNQDESITSIAFRVGFHDSSYFSRQFRLIVGCSPREFRSRGGV